MYCIKCGVELEEGAKQCPLCETPVPEIKGLYENEFVKEYPIISHSSFSILEIKI